MWRTIWIAAFLVISMPSSGSAKDGLAVGKRVRLTTAPETRGFGRPDPARVVREQELVGTLVAADERHLTVRLADRPREQARAAVFERDTRERLIIPRADITSLAVREVTRSRKKQALVGAAIGAGFGAIMGASQGGEYAAIGAIINAPLGALIGAAIPPAQEWREVPARSARVGLAPRSGRPAVSITVAF